MKIELPVRWMRKSDDPDKVEQRRINRLVNGADEDIDDVDDPREPQYDLMVIDGDDIKHFNRMDDIHTIVTLDDGDAYVINIPYQSFKGLYTQLTGQIIQRVGLRSIVDPDILAFDEDEEDIIEDSE